MRNLSRLLTLALVLVMCFSIVGCDILLGGRAVPLSAPTNVRVNGGVLSWNFVEHAIGYTVKIVEGANSDINSEGREIPVSETQYSLASLSDGDYTLGVKARGDAVLYSNSGYTTIQYNHKNTGGDDEIKEVIGPFGSFSEVNTQSSFLGYGINIISADSISSKNVLMNYAIFDMEKLMGENLLMSNEYGGKLEEIEGKSAEEFKQKLSHSTSVSAGSAVSASANIYGVDVSGEVALSGGVSSGFKQSTANAYSQHFLELISENRNYWLVLQSTESRYKELLSEEFKNDLYNPSFKAADLFAKYGTHVLVGAAMGGNITMFYTLYSESSEVTRDDYLSVVTELRTSAQASYGPYSAGASGSLNTDDITTAYEMAKSKSIQIEKNIIITGGSGDFGMQDEASIRANYSEWQKSLKNYPVLSGIKDSNSLYPIWKLIDTTVPGGAERAEEIAVFFAEYGTEAYNSMLELHSIKPPVAPEAIKNVNVKDIVNYKEGQEVQIRAGDVFQITYDIEPGNASKYYKSFLSDNKFVEVDENGKVTVAEDIPHNTKAVVTVTIGSIKLNISMVAVRSCTVVFNTLTDEVSVDKIVGIPYGNLIDEPTVLREGFILQGWYTDRDNTQVFDFENDYVTSDLTLYAKWVAIKPLVIFNSMGGDIVSSQVLAYNGVASRPRDPAKSGYTFAGWYTDSYCTDAFDFATKVTEDIELFARWEKKIYTVTFITDGTDVAPVTTDVERNYLIGEQFTEKTYYVFTGWYRDNGVKFNFDEKVTSDITLTARWELKEIPVRFIDDDGATELAVAYTDYSKGFKISGAPAVSKAGYVFLGWRESLNSADTVTDFTEYEFSEDGKDYVFYAKWIDVEHAYPVSIVINYIFADGTTAYESFRNTDDYYYEDEYSIESPEIAGYSPDIKVVRGNMPVDGITVDVTYTPAPYKLTIKYSMEDGSEAPEEYSEWYKFGEEYRIETPTVVGYTPSFELVSGVMDAENISVSIQYKPNVYSIVYHANGGTGTMTPTSYVYGVEDRIHTNLFVYSGRHFVGWNTEADGSGTAFKDGESVINLSPEQGGEVNLYAMWVLVEFVVDPNSNTSGQEKVRTDISWAGFNGVFKYGEKFSIPVPYAEYYVFKGWYTEGGTQLTNANGESIACWNIIGTVKIVGEWSKSELYSDYIYISDTSDLKSIEMNKSGVKYMLVKDVEFELGEVWSPLVGEFCGELDGNGKEIKNLKFTNVNNGEYCGFFESINGASVVDLKFINVKVEANSTSNYDNFVGTLAGKALYSTVSGVSVTGEVAATRLGNTYIGGLVGKAEMSTFSGCVNYADVSAAYINYSDIVSAGGIAGSAKGHKDWYCVFINCINYAAIKCTMSNCGHSGGIVGVINSSTYCVFAEQCKNYGTTNVYNGTFLTCYSIGNLYAKVH